MSSTDQIVCPKCGFSNRISFKACHQCGEMLPQNGPPTSGLLSATNRSGGVDFNNQGPVAAGGDIVGRDKIIQNTIGFNLLRSVARRIAKLILLINNNRRVKITLIIACAALVIMIISNSIASNRVPEGLLNALECAEPNCKIAFAQRAATTGVQQTSLFSSNLVQHDEVWCVGLITRFYEGDDWSSYSFVYARDKAFWNPIGFYRENFLAVGCNNYEEGNKVANELNGSFR